MHSLTPVSSTACRRIAVTGLLGQSSTIESKTAVVDGIAAGELSHIPTDCTCLKLEW